MVSISWNFVSQWCIVIATILTLNGASVNG